MPGRDLYLVDSSVWISAFRPGITAPWLSELRSLIIQGRIATNPLIRLELLTGARSEKEFAEIADVLDSLNILEFTGAIWQDACKIGYQLGRKGIHVPSPDIVIAACAIHNHSILYHRDHHFRLIAKHTVLKEKPLSLS